MRYELIAAAVTATVLAAVSNASAAIAWSPSSGATSVFNYTNGQDTTGALGTGIASDSGFLFVPAGFKSTTSNGGIDNVSDTASVDLTAAPGRTFTSINTEIVGDFSILGVGTANSVATLSVTNLDTLAFLTTPLLFTGTPAISVTNTSGAFDGLGTLALPAGWTHIRLNVSDTLSTTAGPGSSALIQAKIADLGVTTALPEPTIAIAALGLVGALRRTRR